jgi:hypothetical protein
MVAWVYACMTCILPASYLHPTCILPPSYLHPTSILPASYLHPTCILPASYLHPTCILPASYLHPTSILPASYLHPTCILPPSYLHPTSILPASYLHPTCILPASYLHPTCILPCGETEALFGADADRRHDCLVVLVLEASIRTSHLYCIPPILLHCMLLSLNSQQHLLPHLALQQHCGVCSLRSAWLRPPCITPPTSTTAVHGHSLVVNGRDHIAFADVKATARPNKWRHTLRLLWVGTVDSLDLPAAKLTGVTKVGAQCGDGGSSSRMAGELQVAVSNEVVQAAGSGRENESGHRCARMRVGNSTRGWEEG